MDAPRVINIAERAIKVTWMNPIAPNGPLTDVTASARKVIPNLLEDSADIFFCNRTIEDDTSCVITGLKIYTNYSVTVFGYNAPLGGIGGGYGNESASSKIRTAPGSMHFLFAFD